MDPADRPDRVEVQLWREDPVDRVATDASVAAGWVGTSVLGEGGRLLGGSGGGVGGGAVEAGLAASGPSARALVVLLPVDEGLVGHVFMAYHDLVEGVVVYDPQSGLWVKPVLLKPGAVHVEAVVTEYGTHQV